MIGCYKDVMLLMEPKVLVKAILRSGCIAHYIFIIIMLAVQIAVYFSKMIAK
jgi:hypothetical protein